MNPNTFPTKGNLILAKNSLALASQGYELMDKKRTILIRELMALIDQAKDRPPIGRSRRQISSWASAKSRRPVNRSRWRIRLKSKPGA